MTEKEVNAFAKKCGFDVARFGWKRDDGTSVYIPDFTDGEEHCIGLPMYIIVEGETIRTTKDLEGFSVAEEERKIFGDDEEEEYDNDDD